ncbi:MAG: hypothetical protein M0R21_10685 [Lentimicrobiaceae bacterium]|nr:hypothetical protein [Lentimicrobiaceae bacterium]
MKNIFIFFTCILFISSTCEREDSDCHKTIQFINNSNKSLYLMGDLYYPDTLDFIHSSSPEPESTIYKVYPNKNNTKALRRRVCFEDAFDDGMSIPSDTLMVYVFDAEIIEKIPWSSVTHYYLVLKRYDLSLQDLQRMNWTITYP